MKSRLVILAAADSISKIGFGDPSFAGWLVVAVYLGCAILCVMAGRAERHSWFPRNDVGPALFRPRPAESTTSPAFWWTAAAILLFLGINRQLDLQTILADFARSLAKTQHWYEDRRTFQRMFIAAVGVAGLIAMVAVSWSFRRAEARYHMALGGLVFLLTFVAIRAASFHGVDAFIGRRILGLKWNWILELGGIGLVAASAILCLLGSRTIRSSDRPDDHQGVRKYRIVGR